MNTATFLLLALLPAYQSAAQQASTATLTGPQITAITKALVTPVVYVTGWAQASVKARAALCRQLRERFPDRRPPDKALVRACLRLTLRLNNAWLQGFGGRRLYPGQEDFDRFAEAALEALRRYSSGLPAEHVWGPNDDRAAQDMLDRELRLGVSRLPYCGTRPCPPDPAPAEEEKSYLPPSRPPARPAR